MFVDQGFSGFGSCFARGVFGMPKRFHEGQSQDNRVIFQFSLDVEVLLKQRLDGLIELFGYV